MTGARDSGLLSEFCQAIAINPATFFFRRERKQSFQGKMAPVKGHSKGSSFSEKEPAFSWSACACPYIINSKRDRIHKTDIMMSNF